MDNGLENRLIAPDKRREKRNNASTVAAHADDFLDTLDALISPKVPKS